MPSLAEKQDLELANRVITSSFIPNDCSCVPSCGGLKSLIVVDSFRFSFSNLCRQSYWYMRFSRSLTSTSKSVNAGDLQLHRLSRAPALECSSHGFSKARYVLQSNLSLLKSSLAFVQLGLQVSARDFQRTLVSRSFARFIRPS
jgi:hypothetical protein